MPRRSGAERPAAAIRRLLAALDERHIAFSYQLDDTEVAERLLNGALEQDDRPRDQVAALECQTDSLPALRAKLIEALGA